MEAPKKSLWQRIKRLLILLLNWRFLICFGLAWMITNGWSYVLFALGTLTGSTWMLAVSGAYLAFLWLPISPEKVVTCAIALVLVRLLFPKHQQALSAQVKEIFKSDKPKKDKKHKKKTTENTESAEQNNSEQTK
ncbi:MAG: hypothetical protein IJW49_03505 [Clostridia bacterium]|nr:hypothetical protein [Clostridia bacterium]